MRLVSVKATMRADRHLPQSARRYGEWLLSRPVKGQPDVFRGGQKDAARHLGLSVRTVSRCEDALIEGKYFELHERGVRRRRYSTFRLIYNLPICPVVGASKTGTRGQVLARSTTGHSVRLYMTSATTTTQNGSERSETSRDEKQGRSEEQVAAHSIVAALSLNGRRNVCTGLRTHHLVRAS